jgi:hypothetical protein
MKFKLLIFSVALACFVPLVSSEDVVRAQSAQKAQRKVASYSCPIPGSHLQQTWPLS